MKLKSVIFIYIGKWNKLKRIFDVKQIEKKLVSQKLWSR